MLRITPYFSILHYHIFTSADKHYYLYLFMNLMGVLFFVLIDACRCYFYHGRRHFRKLTLKINGQSNDFSVWMTLRALLRAAARKGIWERE